MLSYPPSFNNIAVFSLTPIISVSLNGVSSATEGFIFDTGSEEIFFTEGLGFSDGSSSSTISISKGNSGSFFFVEISFFLTGFGFSSVVGGTGISCSVGSILLGGFNKVFSNVSVCLCTASLVILRCSASSSSFAFLNFRYSLGRNNFSEGRANFRFFT